MNSVKTLDTQTIEALKRLSTTCLSDTMDRLGIATGLKDIKPVSLTPGHKMCGQAFTVRYIPCGEVKGTVGDFLDDVAPGQVCVLDNGGRDYCTVWGDIMSMLAVQKGIEGTVIYGVCRDVYPMRQLGYTMFALGHIMVTGKDRVELAEINGPVTVAGIKVCPGDVVFGDDTGVIVIPLDKVERVLSIAQEIEEKEEKIRKAIKSGMSLKEARALTNYHHLQTKQ